MKYPEKIETAEKTRGETRKDWTFARLSCSLVGFNKFCLNF